DRCPVEQKVCGRSWGLVTDGLIVPYKFIQISTGERHSCGLLVDGTALCWGDNLRGVVGDTGTKPALIPRKVATTEKFSRIAGGKLGVGTTTNSSLPLRIADPTR